MFGKRKDTDIDISPFAVAHRLVLAMTGAQGGRGIAHYSHIPSEDIARSAPEWERMTNTERADLIGYLNDMRFGIGRKTL